MQLVRKVLLRLCGVDGITSLLKCTRRAHKGVSRSRFSVVRVELVALLLSVLPVYYQDKELIPNRYVHPKERLADTNKGDGQAVPTDEDQHDILPRKRQSIS